MVFYNRVKEQKGEKKNIFDNKDLKNAEKNVTLYFKKLRVESWELRELFGTILYTQKCYTLNAIHYTLNMDKILKYFPNLTEEQKGQYAALFDLYKDWNSKINVISRKDIDNLYEHHVLHSLAIAKTLRFQPGTTLVDVGTGGGFPGIP